MMKANSGNRSGQSIQNGEAGFTAFFRFAVLRCLVLRCMMNGARVGWRYSTRFGTGIVSSVAVVWFVFQSVDWIFVNIINKIIMAWGDPAREKLREEGRKEAEEQARREEAGKARAACEGGCKVA